MRDKTVRIAAILGTVAFAVIAIALIVVWLPNMTPAPASSPSARPAPSKVPTMDFSKTPAWARPVSATTVMWQTTKDGVTITAMNAGQDTARYDSKYSSDTDNTLMVAKGDPIAYVNIVVTNTGAKTIYVDRLGPYLWASAGGFEMTLTTVVHADDTQAKKHGVYFDMVAPGKMAKGFGYPLQPGESCAAARAVPLKYGKDFQFLPRLMLFPDAKALTGETAVGFDQVQTYTFA